MVMRSTNRSEEHTSELQSRPHLVCRLLLDTATTEIYTLSLHDALPILATIKKRNGEGGKGIKFASKYLQRLVKGSEYSKNLPEDLEKTAKVYKEHIDILIDYGNAIYE